ncbi:hypothetical protein FHG87_011274 [Trinorchestia longiramus]|nr:hypothetical protein FHG87_011274 [Trinorchestia longiramus]
MSGQHLETSVIGSGDGRPLLVPVVVMHKLSPCRCSARRSLLISSTEGLVLMCVGRIRVGVMLLLLLQQSTRAQESMKEVGEEPLFTEADRGSDEVSVLTNFDERNERSVVMTGNTKDEPKVDTFVKDGKKPPMEAADEEGGKPPAETGGDGNGITEAVGDERDTEEDRAKFIFIKGYSTQTHTIVSFTTSTVPLTCFGGFSPAEDIPACMGKRRKRSTKPINRNWSEGSFDIESSQGFPSATEVDLTKKGRKFFTVWTKSFTTTTLTTISTDSATTLSLSYYCSAGNLEIPNIGC